MVYLVQTFEVIITTPHMENHHTQRTMKRRRGGKIWKIKMDKHRIESGGGWGVGRKKRREKICD